MKKIVVMIFVFIGILLTSIFVPLGNTSTRATVANRISSAGIMAPPSPFPTNATFETNAEVIGNISVGSIGGTGSDYYAQSFNALSDYIINGGLWIEHYAGVTPAYRLMLCNTTEAGWPNIANYIFLTPEISNETIYARPGRFYLNLTRPIRVQQNKTYWLVIDGNYSAVAGTCRSKRRGDNPYPYGNFAYSNSNGTNWTAWTSSDLDLIVTFSNRPNKAEVFGTTTVASVGGSSGSNYYAQSFKALDGYIVDAGIWIEKYLEPTPNFNIQIWASNASGYPDKYNVLANSTTIKGSTINSTEGQRWFVHPNVSIPVTVGERYWLVIDGYHDHTTAGRARSRRDPNNPYPDGNFAYSNNVGSTWTNWSGSDLDFIVTFSAQKTAIMVDGPNSLGGIGGTGSTNYYGESFKALNKYILDASVWLENYTNNCPDIRILLCEPLPSNDPDVVSFMWARNLTGADIMSQSGRFYLQPTKPIEVIPGQTYFLIIDGWNDNTTAASVMTRYNSGNTYTEGQRCYSNDGGATWYYSNTYDVDVDIRFSDVPYKAQSDETTTISSVGGQGSYYYAQSFVALNDYIADAGVWIEQNVLPTPNMRVFLCHDSGGNPNVTDVIAMSMVIGGSTIDANPGLFYIKPTTPIPVEIGQTYWIVIDGAYDRITAGRARSRGVLNMDIYLDGVFKYSNSLTGAPWFTHSLKDLKLDVVFTHANQPPTQPDVTISPPKPFDSDDLTVSFPIPSADFEEEPVLYYVEWYKNDVPQPAWANNIVVLESATLPTEDWMAKVTPYDGHINGTSASYTVHVQADILTIDHSLVADSQTFHVFTKSNATITDFDFQHTTQGAPAFITFTATGPNGAKSFCNVTIPKNLMYGSWAFVINGTLTPPTPPYVTITENGTHAFVYLSYDTSSVPIIIQGSYIVPEFTPTMFILALVTITLAVAIVKKKTAPKKR